MKLKELTKHFQLIPLVALCCIFFAGCIEFGEDIWVNADGTGRMTIDIALPEALMSLGGAAKPDSADDMHTKFNTMQQKFKADARVTSVKFRDSLAGEMRHMIFDVTTKSSSDIPAVHEMFFADSGMSDPSSGSPGKPVVTLASNGATMQFTFMIPPDKNADTTAKPDSLGDAITNSMLGNSGFTLRVHAPVITNTNGKIDTTAHTVEWKLPLTELKHASGKSFHADLALPAAAPTPTTAFMSTTMMIWIIGAIVVGIVMVMVVKKKIKTNA